MRKSQAIEFLGGSIGAASETLGISYQAVNQWPDVLPIRIADRVLGACVRNGIAIPPEFTVSAGLSAAKSAEEPLTSDPALNAVLTGAEQAGLVKLPHPAPAWDGVERRVAQAPRRAVDREPAPIPAAGHGA